MDQATKIKAAPSGVRKRRVGGPQAPGSSAKLRRLAAAAAAVSHKMPEPPKIPEFAFSDLMRKMASNYQDNNTEEANKE